MHQERKPVAMSGGNDAACLPNAFGFGSGMPVREFPPHTFRPDRDDYHRCDKSEDVGHLLNFMRVHALGVIALDALDSIKEK